MSEVRPLRWELSRSKKEWRLHPPGTDRRRRPLAVVGKSADCDGWIGFIQACIDFHGAISNPFRDVEDAVRWAEELIHQHKELSCLFDK